MRKLLTAAALLALAGPAWGQAGVGQLPPFNVVGNPSATPAPGTSATMTQIFDGAFCATPGSALLRGASLWACAGTASLDVRSFGAVCDGVVDDAAAIQTAIASGKNLFFPAMCGVGTAGLLINAATNQVLEGASAGGIKLLGISSRTLASFPATTLAISASSDIIIRNMQFDGNGFASSLIGMYQCTECRIDGNVTTSGGSGAATIYVIGGIRNVISNNIIKNNLVTGGNRALSIGNTNPGELEQFPIVTGNQIRNVANDGFVLIPYGATVSNNIVDTCGASGLIVSAFAAGVTGSRTTITGNVFRKCAFHGIQADAASGRAGPGIDVVGNIAELNNGCGIYVTGATAWTVVGNQANDNGVGGVSGCLAGITVGAADHITITGNQVYNTTVGGARTQQTGILLLAQTSAFDTSDVVISGNNVWNNTGAGISTQSGGPGTFRNVAITGNTSTANSTYGYFAAEDVAGDDANLLIDGNIFTGNTTADFNPGIQNTVIGDNSFLTSTFFDFTVTNNSATPNVGSRSQWLVSNTSPTTITNLLNGVPGQMVTLIFTTANTTVQNGTNFLLAGNVNQLFTANSTLTLRRRASGLWYEVGRSLL